MKTTKKTMIHGFDQFYQDKNYILVKNYLFNYLNRKNQIKNIFYKNSSKNHKSILDIGSGISPVSPVPEKTLFMDISKEGLVYLKNKGYKTRYGSITKIPLNTNSVDIIFCSEVLEHIDDHKKAINEMYRVLKNNGELILTIPVYKKYWGFDDEFVGHIRRFEPNDLTYDLEGPGFRIIEEKPIGSLLERILTKIIVKIFHRKKKINIFKYQIIIWRSINIFL